MRTFDETKEGLDHPDRGERLKSLRVLADRLASGELPAPVREGCVNNHIHTIYSFSPYSPSAAVWRSFSAGLETAGVMDHDSLAGAEEFIEAGGILGLATTVGIECRTDFRGTRLEGRRINNPDQLSNAYVAIHGIPRQCIEAADEFFAPLRESRNERNRNMVGRLDEFLQSRGRPELGLDFEADVLPLSRSAEGGSVTERHILFALAGRLMDEFGAGPAVLRCLQEDLVVRVSGKTREFLASKDNPYYRYDLLGALKSGLVSAFYVDADEECLPVRDVTAFAGEIGAIPAYAYLGDVGESVTGDKKAQRFEDGYLDILFETLVEVGFQAVTYMPSRNSGEQLAWVAGLCDKHGLFRISGEDINSPRQSFVCAKLKEPEFRGLVDSTWALIGHEKEAARRLEAGMFSPATIERMPALDERIRHFKAIGERKA